jgi:hypothetical protein
VCRYVCASRNGVLLLSHAGEDSILGSPLVPGWSHLTFIYDVNSKRQSIIHNGLMMEAAYSAPDHRRRPLRSALTLRIGREHEMPRGYIRELRIWKSVRSLEDIKANRFECFDALPLADVKRLARIGGGGLKGAWSFRGSVVNALGVKAGSAMLGGTASAGTQLTWLGAEPWWYAPPTFKRVQAPTQHPLVPEQSVYVRPRKLEWARGIYLGDATEQPPLPGSNEARFAVLLETTFVLSDGSLHSSGAARVLYRPLSAIIPNTSPSPFSSSFQLPVPNARTEQTDIDHAFASYWDQPPRVASANRAFELTSKTPPHEFVTLGSTGGFGKP